MPTSSAPTPTLPRPYYCLMVAIAATPAALCMFALEMTPYISFEHAAHFAVWMVALGSWTTFIVRWSDATRAAVNAQLAASLAALAERIEALEKSARDQWWQGYAACLDDHAGGTRRVVPFRSGDKIGDSRHRVNGSE